MMMAATIIIPMCNQAITDADKLSKISEAKRAASELAAGLNRVYAMGPGSSLTVEYSLPDRVLTTCLGGYENLDADGIVTADETVPINGCADIQILMDLNGDGMWDNLRDSVVIVDTILPSRWNEDGTERGEEWVKENCVHVEEQNLKIGPEHNTLSKRTFHQTTFIYCYDPSNQYPHRIVVLDEIR
ncbi:MAG: hypothetical protein ACPL6F_00570 [Anaerolineales bacterium]|uniref:hypothetical protein n=1 Tax=Candidatus Hadarchaeum sp. TaxID=2883567 RepID=UPI003C960247